MLQQFEPNQVFYYFQQLCQIPHGSGNTKQISDYIVSVAREHHIQYIQDEWNNVILFQPATKGYEDAPAVILQGHMDMVCEKEADCLIDFQKDGLELMVDGDWIFAKGTTLGGDDGIAIAYGLALVTDTKAEHPDLELVFTVDEETGMDGAIHIDLSMLRGRMLLNIDSEEEGVLTCGCAGGMGCQCSFPLERNPVSKIPMTIQVDGLTGGHSGVEINKHRGNANILLGRVLHQVFSDTKAQLVHLEGGKKDNAIPRMAEARLAVDPSEAEQVFSICQSMETCFQHEYGVADPNVQVKVCQDECHSMEAISYEASRQLAAYLISIPNGVQEMSADIEGLVETSLNLGILYMSDTALTAEFSLRSSVESRKFALSKKLSAITEAFGGMFTCNSVYPGWEYNRNSPLRQLMVQTYKEMFGTEPKQEVIHAGLECGLLAEKLPGLDCVSIGPLMHDIHTPKERLSISSTKRTWEYILEILRKCK